MRISASPETVTVTRKCDKSYRKYSPAILAMAARAEMKPREWVYMRSNNVLDNPRNRRAMLQNIAEYHIWELSKAVRSSNPAASLEHRAGYLKCIPNWFQRFHYGRARLVAVKAMALYYINAAKSTK